MNYFEGGKKKEGREKKRWQTEQLGAKSERNNKERKKWK